MYFYRFFVKCSNGSEYDVLFRTQHECSPEELITIVREIKTLWASAKETSGDLFVGYLTDCLEKIGFELFRPDVHCDITESTGVISAYHLSKIPKGVIQ